jgi:hypothetical protein
MFEKVSQRAEKIVARLPRRAFLGKAARMALPLAATVAALLASPGRARAIGRGTWYCCYDASGNPVCQARTGPCCPQGTQPGPCRPSNDRPLCC